MVDSEHTFLFADLAGFTALTEARSAPRFWRLFPPSACEGRQHERADHENRDHPQDEHEGLTRLVRGERGHALEPNSPLQAPGPPGRQVHRAPPTASARAVIERPNSPRGSRPATASWAPTRESGRT